MIPNGVPVNCSLCQWYALAANYDEACRLADRHLDEAHRLGAPQIKHPCETCLGVRHVWDYTLHQWKTCPACKGTGKKQEADRGKSRA